MTCPNCSKDFLPHPKAGGTQRYCSGVCRSRFNGRLPRARAQVRRYYRAHKVELAGWSKKWRRNNPEKLKAYYATVAYKYYCLTNSARNRNIPVTLGKEEYAEIISHPCFYCNSPLANGGHGLDRIDSAMGYVAGNVRPCCTICNLSKNDWTEEEFKEWIIRVYNHWINK
jgi:hypothetical protein